MKFACYPFSTSWGKVYSDVMKKYLKIGLIEIVLDSYSKDEPLAIFLKEVFFSSQNELSLTVFVKLCFSNFQRFPFSTSWGHIYTKCWFDEEEKNT